MAIAEREITRPLSVNLTQGQREKLEQAAFSAGLSVPDFTAAALIQTVEIDPLERVIGVFQDEPLMDALIERVREDRRIEMNAEGAS